MDQVDSAGQIRQDSARDPCNHAECLFVGEEPGLTGALPPSRGAENGRLRCLSAVVACPIGSFVGVKQFGLSETIRQTFRRRANASGASYRQ